MNSKIKKAMFIILILAVIFFICLSIYDNYKKQYQIEEVIDEKYKVNIVDNKMGIVDTNGNVVIDSIYDAIQIPNPSKPIFVCFYDYNPEVGSYRTKVINENGTEIFTKYNEVSVIELVDIDTNMPFEKSVLKYRENNKWGLIDLKGNVVLQPKYDSIEGLRNKEGELLICEDGQYGVISTKGAELIKAEYDYVTGDEYYTQKDKYALSGYILGLKTNTGYLSWITQLVVNKKFRNRGIARRLLISVWGFSGDRAWGLATSNPLTVKTLESATFRKVTFSTMQKNFTELQQIAKEVDFIANRKLEITSENAVVNTNFFVRNNKDIEIV